MKLKTSYKFPIVFLSFLITMVLLIFLLQSNKKKSNKYPETPLTEQSTTLNLIQLTLNEKAFNKIKKKRDKALSVGILEAQDSDYVPATITFNGQDFRAEVRLKGDWTTHLEGEKWSFRVKLKGDKTILGMRKFSLHHPVTRLYLNEWLYHKSMKSEDLMGLRYNFVEGKIHIKSGDNYIHKDVGIYALEETFDKRTIESNKRKESVIIKFSEDYWWNEVKQASAISRKFGMKYSDFMNYGLVGNAKAPITVFSESKVLEDSTMTNYFKLSKNLIEDLRQNKINISDAFDVKKLAMDNALTNLFGAIHGTHSINVRYYYNPITSKLEPISFDGNSGLKLKEYIKPTYSGKETDTLFMKALANALNKVSQPSYLNNLVASHRNDIDYYSKILKTEFKTKVFHEDNLRYNQTIIREELKRLVSTYGFTLNQEIITKDTNFVKTDFETPNLSEFKKWKSTGIAINNDSRYRKENILSIARTSTEAPAYVKIDNINVSNGSYYEVVFKVKKDGKNSQFGLRIVGAYPNRVDAMFNLNTGKLNEVSTVGYFEDGTATIKKLQNSWYQCTLKVKPNTDKINIIFGPTDNSKTVNGWEGKSNIVSKVLVNTPKLMEYKP